MPSCVGSTVGAARPDVTSRRSRPGEPTRRPPVLPGIEFTIAEIAVVLVLRTNRPFFRSRPARALLATSASLAAVTIAVPYTPLAHPLGLVGLHLPVLASLAGLTVLYVLAAELTKRRFPPDHAGAPR